MATPLGQQRTMENFLLVCFGYNAPLPDNAHPVTAVMKQHLHDCGGDVNPDSVGACDASVHGDASANEALLQAPHAHADDVRHVCARDRVRGLYGRANDRAALTGVAIGQRP